MREHIKRGLEVSRSRFVSNTVHNIPADGLPEGIVAVCEMIEEFISSDSENKFLEHAHA